GHSLSKPVSRDMPLRCSPRNCGQSSARNVNVVMPTVTKMNRRQGVFIWHLERMGVRFQTRLPAHGRANRSPQSSENDCCLARAYFKGGYRLVTDSVVGADRDD